MLLFIPFILSPITFTANAALSATTANTIQGSKPYLLLSDGVTKLTSTAELLGFSMWDGTYEADGITKHRVQITSDQAGILNAPAGLKYSDVITLVTADGSNRNLSGVTVGDSDGDAAITANTSVTGTMKATWYNGVTQVTNLNQTLSVCGGPYTLKIESTNIQANTTYGDPNINSYTNTSKTYTFTSTSLGICYLKPKDLTIYTTDVSISGGYNSSVFDTTNGFKVNSGFPTTGFNKAVFSLIGSGSNQNLFRCKTTSSAITLSTASGVGSNCTVTYNTVTKPTSPITINMEYNDGGTWIQIDSFTIPIPTKWAISRSSPQYGNMGSLATSTSFPALNECRKVGSNADNGTTTWQQAAGQNLADRTFRQKYLYRRNELTNASQTNAAEGSSPASGGRFSRDTDGADSTFMGEWGYVYNAYPGSGWSIVNGFYTAEARSTDYQFVITTSGGVGYASPSISYTTMCRGE